MRPWTDGSPDYRACIVALAEAMDRLIAASRRGEESEAWLKSLIGLAGDVHDLLKANARLDQGDLQDVCDEVGAFLTNFETSAMVEPGGRGALSHLLELRAAHADGVQLLNEMPTGRRSSEI